MTGRTIKPELVTGASWPYNFEARNEGTEYGKLVDGQLDRLAIGTHHLDHISNPRQSHVDAYAAVHGYKPLEFATPVVFFGTSTWTDTGTTLQEGVEPWDLEAAKKSALNWCGMFQASGCYAEGEAIPCAGIGKVVWSPGQAWWSHRPVAGMSVLTTEGDVVLTATTAAALEQLRADMSVEADGAYTDAVTAINVAETVADVEAALASFGRHFCTVTAPLEQAAVDAGLPCG